VVSLKQIDRALLSRHGSALMARTKQASKRTRRSKALPVLGIAGVSFSLAGAASASTAGPATDIPHPNTSLQHQFFLGEEEISDVNLSTFYVFDKENVGIPQIGKKLAWGCGCGRCGGCGGCRCGWRGCAGCAGCGACAPYCISRGGCNPC
jgi:hypothetical protein